MMDKFGAEEIAIVFLLGIVPLIVWAAGSSSKEAELPKDFQDELKKRMEERLRNHERTNEKSKPLE